MKELDRDTVALLSKRVYDLAGISPKAVKVYLNDKKIEIDSFEKYVELYFGKDDIEVQKFHEKCSERWEICVVVRD